MMGFIEDFNSNSTPQGIVLLKDWIKNNPEGIRHWKGLADRPEWVRKNTDLLNKLVDLNDDNLTARVNEFYSVSHQKPSNCNPPCLHPTPYGDVPFDKYGFPDFLSPSYMSDMNHKFEFGNQLSGNPSDFTKGKDALQAYLNNNGGGIVKKANPTGNWSPFIIEKNGIPEGPFTWHHHQDGQTLISVRQDVHQAVNPHTGGSTIALNYSLLKGLFKY